MKALKQKGKEGESFSRPVNGDLANCGQQAKILAKIVKEQELNLHITTRSWSV